MRIFPGKKDMNDIYPATRRQVDLVATVEPLIAGVPVSFRVFDVDDPFDQLNPAMPNVGVIDNNTSGPDNRGAESVSLPWTASAPVDASGQARATFVVSMQPGNNYRAAASLSAEPLDDTTHNTADAINNNNPSTPGAWTGVSDDVFWSPMLTVWRKLHVETDTMARPTFGENTIGTQWNDPRFPSGTLTLDVSDQFDADDFQNGFIRIKATGFPDLVTRIITFRHSVFDDEIDTSITQTQWGARPDVGTCTLSDDDLADEANFTAGVVGSDIGTGNPPNGFLPLPDTSGLADPYVPAYIVPVVEVEHTSTTGITFIKNMNSGNPAQWDPARLSRGLPIPTSDYWSVYVFSAFQEDDDEDADSETLNTKGINTHSDGSTTPALIFGSPYTAIAAIFKETLDDAYGVAAEQRTVAHEIAHCLGAPHLGVKNTPGDGGLMDETEQGPDFLAESLKRLREYAGP